jgi:hypothetical protein
MRQIKTDNYIKKEAQWSLPGDPSLPPGVTEEVINERVGPEDNIKDNIEGGTEVEVIWGDFNKWYLEGGEALPGDMGRRTTPSSVWIDYTYSYDYNANEPSNIKGIKVKDYMTNQDIVDPYVVESFVDYYSDKIIEDIEIAKQV